MDYLRNYKQIATRHLIILSILLLVNKLITGVNIHMPDNLQCHAKVSNGSIAGQYDLSAVISFSKNKELGRGVFATVYEGTFNNKCCAVKILNHVAIHLISDVPTGPCDDPIQSRTLQNFTRECEYLITMNHPKYCQTYRCSNLQGKFSSTYYGKVRLQLDCLPYAAKFNHEALSSFDLL